MRRQRGSVDRQAPWALNKTDKARMGAFLRVLVDTLRVVATVLQPFMPGSMSRMLDQLGVAVDQRQLAALGTPLADGIVLPPPQGSSPLHRTPPRSNADVDRFALPSRLLHADGTARRAGARVRRRGGRAGHHRHHLCRNRKELPALAEAHDNLWCTIGVHPHHAAEAPIPTPETLAALTRHPKVIGIGKSRGWITSTTVRRVMCRRRISAPIFVARGWPGCRWRSMRATLMPISRGSCRKNATGGGDFAFLLHCFSSSARAG